MNKPLIGVTSSVKKGYLTWVCIRLGIWLAGGKARRLTADNFGAFQQCAGYLISGGVDIDPTHYGQKNKASFNLEPARDLLEKEVIQHSLKEQKPLVGICRGMQMINIVLGGNLHQEARDIYADFLPTTSLLGKTFQRRLVTTTHKGKIFEIFNQIKLSVNSIHHQAINQIGDGLLVSVKDKHGIPQAIESTDSKLIFGVQWHPELMLHEKKQRQFFKHLVDAC